jgi:hypothetical protein
MSLPEFRRATAGFRLSRLTIALIGGLTLLAASPTAAEPALWKVRAARHQADLAKDGIIVSRM